MGERFNLQRVLNQLRYTGILDTVRVRASGPMHATLALCARSTVLLLAAKLS
jgi:hypothetical protein